MVAVTAAGAGDLVVPLTVDESASTMELRLTVLTGSDVQTQHLSGSLLLALDCLAPLETVALRDFQFRAVTNPTYHLVYSGWPSGDLWATMTNFAMRHAAPGPHQPAVGFHEGSGTFLQVPFLLEGWVAYRAEGGICDLLTNTSYGCAGTVDLGARPLMTLDTFEAHLALASNRLDFDGIFHFSEPIDPTVPMLGSISGRTHIVAGGPAAPCLRIEPDIFEHRLRWATNFADFWIETNATPASATGWQPVGVEPVLDGATYMQTFDWGPAPRMFYRLKSR